MPKTMVLVIDGLYSKCRNNIPKRKQGVTIVLDLKRFSFIIFRYCFRVDCFLNSLIFLIFYATLQIGNISFTHFSALYVAL